MDVLIKLTSQKIALICAVLLLSACGGSSSSRNALSPTAELEQLAADAVPQALIVAPTGFNSNEIVSAGLSAAAGQPVDAGLPGIADVFIGTLDVPYYFDPAQSTSSFWLPSLAVRAVLTVPVMMTIPNVGTAPAEGWPIAIYQHGITRNRTDVVIFADALAQAGFATIAIDLPTHGIVDPNSPFNAANTPFPTDTEQTFNTTDPLAPNTVSGQNFINIPSLLTSRDNVRQGAANLLSLRQSLGGIINAATGTGVAIDTSRVGLFAHSLGGIVATVYLGVETTPTPSSLLNTGSDITTVLRESPTFGPVIAAGLAPLGITSEADLDTFYEGAQVSIDSGDPSNYAAQAAATHRIHMTEVIGDQTVPNVSTENLAALFGANSISTTTPGIAPGNVGIVRFIAGEHGSPLDPTSSPAATAEIQTQVATFQATAGTTIIITDGNVIQ